VHAKSLILAVTVTLLAVQPARADWSGASSPLKPIKALDALDSSVAADVDAEFFAPWTLGSHNRPLTAQERALLTARYAGLFLPNAAGNSLIESQFTLFTQALRPRLRRWITRSERYVPMARRVFATAGLPPQLAYLPFIESGYSPRALSHAGARGIWQFMPATGRRYGLKCCGAHDERTDPAKSTAAAAAYLGDVFTLFGDWGLALAAYNAGEGKIQRLVRETGARNFFELAARNHTVSPERRLRRETLYYVPRFIAMVRIMENLSSLGFDPPAWSR
jgi:membrane-bound lytic murein transglycosylase D